MNSSKYCIFIFHEPVPNCYQTFVVALWLGFVVVLCSILFKFQRHSQCKFLYTNTLQYHSHNQHQNSFSLSLTWLSVLQDSSPSSYSSLPYPLESSSLWSEPNPPPTSTTTTVPAGSENAPSGILIIAASLFPSSKVVLVRLSCRRRIPSRPRHRRRWRKPRWSKMHTWPEMRHWASPLTHPEIESSLLTLTSSVIDTVRLQHTISPPGIASF